MTDAELRPGDILFTSSKSLLGRLIRWGEQSPSEKTGANVNHAAIVVVGGGIEEAVVVEAERRVERNKLLDSHGADLIFGYRPITIPKAAIAAIVAHAEAAVGQGYGWGQLAAQLVDSKLFGGRVVFRNAGQVDKLPICSRLVAECFGVQGYDFGLPAFAADPDTMIQFCDKNPHLYSLVLNYSPD